MSSTGSERLRPRGHVRYRATKNRSDTRLMQDLSVQNFRCFRGQQVARLAPLTLLVGENSTGKTSFLAAVTAILEVANYDGDPDFRAIPYDLGSFPEIAHRQHPHGRHRGAESFSIGVRFADPEVESIGVDATFVLGVGAAPILASVTWSAGDVWIRGLGSDAEAGTELGSASGAWRLPASSGETDLRHLYRGDSYFLVRTIRQAAESGTPGKLRPLQGDTPAVPTGEDYRKLIDLCVNSIGFDVAATHGAPIRSSPRRTYDPVRLTPDSQGFSMPSFLASAYSQDAERWRLMKQRLEEFGRASGLFDEIFVSRLGREEFGPFQLEVRKWGKKRKGPKHNLIDVGYGVSQVLPMLVDLMYPRGSSLFLLQQPEIHLHPSAQAELGSLFCATAASGRQLIIETHSDYLVDRILLDIRDKRTNLKPDDVSVLYFEREDLAVTIHSISIDDEGNVLDAPEGYRKFFKDELQRVIDY